MAKIESRAPGRVTEKTEADTETPEKDGKQKKGGFWSHVFGVFKGHDDKAPDRRGDADRPH